MVVGILRLLVDVPESRSLKDKRSVIQSLKGRIEARFKVSVAEVGEIGNLGQGELGIACVSNDARHADEIMAKIAGYAEVNCGDGSLGWFGTEIIHLG